MNIVKHIVSFVLFNVVPILALAQSGKNIVNQTGSRYYIENEKLSLNSESLSRTFEVESISNDQGKLLFYVDGGKVYAPDHSLLHSPNTYFNDFARARVIKLSNDTYAVVGVNVRYDLTHYALEYYRIRINQDGSIIKIGAQDTIKIFEARSGYSRNLLGSEVIEDTVAGSWFVARTNTNTFINFYFDSLCFGCRTKDISVELSNSDSSKVFDSFVKRSPSGNYLAEIAAMQTKNLIINIYQLDKSSGNLNLVSKWESSDKYSGMDSRLSIASIANFEFSSNDENIFFAPTGSRNSFIDSTFFVHTTINNLSSWNFIYATPKLSSIANYTDVKLLNDRKIYISYLNKLTKTIEFDAIPNPNDSISIVDKQVKIVDDKEYKALGPQFGIAKYNYINIEPTVSYLCNASIKFKDKCDYSLEGTKVEIFIEKEPGSNNFIRFNEKDYSDIASNCKYAYNVILKSDSGTYKEVFHDTVIISIPERPVALFELGDNIICRYGSVEITNLSSSKVSNPDSTSLFIWDLGDGTVIELQDTDRIQHQYSQKGVYDISLLYSNGYCDSTYILTKAITVMDAPTPGFEISAIKGCKPFEVQITDTNWIGVQSKDYYFHDTQEWINISKPNNTFEHVFNLQGKHYITQRLTGYSGCIIQNDSQLVHVYPGLSKMDTSHMQLATFVTNDSVYLSWDSVYGSEAYALYKKIDNTGYKVIHRTSNTYYTDFIEKTGKIQYQIIANDSCGGATSAGRIASPVFLEGNVIGNNEKAELRFTFYEEWMSTSINYNIETLLDGNWVSLNSSLNGQYVDNNFALTGSQDRLYRVKAFTNDNISYSNTLKLNFIPLVYLPSAFSPNGDGLNDMLYPICYGITDYKMEVYSRWGHKIADLSTGESWNDPQITTGVYMVILIVKTSDNQTLYFNQTVTVVD